MRTQNSPELAEEKLCSKLWSSRLPHVVENPQTHSVASQSNCSRIDRIVNPRSDY